MWSPTHVQVTGKVEQLFEMFSLFRIKAIFFKEEETLHSSQIPGISLVQLV